VSWGGTVIVPYNDIDDLLGQTKQAMMKVWNTEPLASKREVLDVHSLESSLKRLDAVWMQSLHDEAEHPMRVIAGPEGLIAQLPLV